MFALDMATKHKSILSGDNADICMESLELTKTLITTKSWWDTVDMLASNSKDLYSLPYIHHHAAIHSSNKLHK